MRRAHGVEAVRAAERALMAGLPEGALMQRAAAGLATAVAGLLGATYGARVLLLVGSGDNGGDALHAGALLSRRGVAVEAVLLSEHAHAGGLHALQEAGGRVRSLDEVHRPDVVVDGIVGIGGRPGLRPDAQAAVGRFPDVPVVAVDVPSGVDVESGRLDGPHVRAALTVTFGTLKPCHLLDPAAEACGAVHLVDLGLELPEPTLTALGPEDVARLVRRPRPFDHKYTRGVVGLRTGSAAYPGAAVLGVAAADSGLCGMVRYSGGAADAVRAAHPEVVVTDVRAGTPSARPGRVQAWVVGSGSGDDAGPALTYALDEGVPVVVDADALAHLAPGGGPVVLTPHAGELATLLDVDRASVEAAPRHHALTAARHFDAVVLLKGRRSLTVDPAGRTRVTTTGTPWLASAGTGDVLAGLVGALLASGLTPYDAASVGSWLHGAAASWAGGPLTAARVAAAIPEVVRALLA